MNRFALTFLSAAALISAAHAASTAMSAPPSGSVTVTDYYKQDVYNPQLSKIGSVDDVLVDKSGTVTALVVGVGGFLGMDEKAVMIPFNAVKSEKKNDKYYLTLDASKDSLKSAPGFRYNKTTTAWEPAK